MKFEVEKRKAESGKLELEAGSQNMTDPWDDAGRTQAGFLVNARGLRVPVATPTATTGWPTSQDPAATPAPAGTAGFRGVGPKGYHRSDSQMRDHVCERMLLDPYLDASAIQVRVSKGRVALSGTVPSERMRAAAAAVAESVATGAVDNTIKVAAVSAMPQARSSRGSRRPSTAKASRAASRTKGRRKPGGHR